MGRESKMRKDRVCKSCEKIFVSDAKGIREHAQTCVRLEKLGLVLVGGVDRI